MQERLRHRVPALTPEIMSALESALSAPRLGPYLQATASDRERAIRLYYWNSAIGESFHFPIQTLEVSLRNSISRVFQTAFGPAWCHERHAYRFLGPRASKDVRAACTRLARRAIQPAYDDIIASLPFGFWSSLLTPRFKPSVWDKHLRDAFPSLPEAADLGAIHQAINRTLHLRNRIFHHEPLIELDLDGHYARILDVLFWISPDTHTWVRENSTVTSMLAAKP